MGHIPPVFLKEVTVFRRLLAALCLVAAASLAPVQRASHAAPLTTVSFALNWLTNVEFASIWVAQEKGWWAQAGLQINVRGYDFNNDPVVLVGAGKYEFGFQDGASIIIARAQGKIPLTAIYAETQKSPFAFITMPNSGIKTVQDFRGKRIGYQAHQLYVLESMLNAVGMTLKDVQPVVVQFDPTVLIAGKVDAYLAFITNEPIALAEAKNPIKVNIIPASQYGYDFYSDVLFTTDSLIKSNPSLVKKVVSIIDKGWQYAIAHPAETANIVVPKLDKSDTVRQQTEEMKALGSLSSLKGVPLGGMTAARWQNGINLLLKYKQIPAAIPVSSVFTTQFLSGM
jgi:ABC-type nitrate/sulfonate/bicarbonate transport system substrate-binding protein